MTKTLGDRMKEYENVTDTVLYHRSSIILRIDGRAFHTLTSFMERPYDNNFIDLMNKTMVEVFNSFPDTTLGYVQSDEISILMCPYATYETEPVFGARIQKISSVAASIATQAFIKNLYSMTQNDETKEWAAKCLNGNITFDCRCFNLPKEEVINYFRFRQQDCTRNSILNAGHFYIGKKKCHGFKTPDIIEALKEKGIDYWTTWPNYVHYGRSCYRGEDGHTKLWTIVYGADQVVQAVDKMVDFNYENRSEYIEMLERCVNDTESSR